jgi:hypothetical protein
MVGDNAGSTSISRKAALFFISPGRSPFSALKRVSSLDRAGRRAVLSNAVREPRPVPAGEDGQLGWC